MLEYEINIDPKKEVINMKYRMVLQALGNPDHGENPYQYIAEPKEITGRTIDELVKQANNWIDENDIGSGNWSMTEVWLTDGNGYGDGHDELIGYMSYNGRIWAENPNEVNTPEEDEFDMVKYQKGWEIILKTMLQNI